MTDELKLGPIEVAPDPLVVAINRLAAAIEQMNAARFWPSVQTMPTGMSNGWTCPRCNSFIPNGTSHSCGMYPR